MTRRARADRWERKRARGLVSSAVKGGRLVRPAVCDRCSAPGRIEAHHTDYARPLAVTWLCRPCHRARHAGRAIDVVGTRFPADLVGLLDAVSSRRGDTDRAATIRYAVIRLIEEHFPGSTERAA